MTNANHETDQEVECTPERKALEAKAATLPSMRHAMASKPFTERATGFDDLDWAALTSIYADECAKTADGNLRAASHMLTAQAMTLDTVFTDLVQRSSRNLGQYPEAAERYMRMALKAQANSRATMEALIRMHQPREQTVKHVYVSEGGQAIVADAFHHHTGERNGKSADQPHAHGAALPGADPFRNGVPIPGSEGPETVQDARRKVDRRAKG